GTLGERDVGDPVGDRPATEDAIRIDRPVARGLHPVGALAAAERADRSRIPVWLVARRAAFDQEPSLGGGIPERLRLRVDRRWRDRGRAARPLTLSPRSAWPCPGGGP